MTNLAPLGQFPPYLLFLRDKIQQLLCTTMDWYFKINGRPRIDIG